MKTIENVNYSELEDAAINAGYELIDVIDGCLVDSVLYSKPGLLIAGFETYLNSCASCLTVKIARTQGDIEKLSKQWDKLAAAIA